MWSARAHPGGGVLNPQPHYKTLVPARLHSLTSPVSVVSSTEHCLSVLSDWGTEAECHCDLWHILLTVGISTAQIVTTGQAYT